MIPPKKSLVFVIFCCCLITVPVFLAGPAGALNSGKITITANLQLITYNLAISGVDFYDATVTWKTNGNTNSTVEYGTTTSYGSLSTDGVMVESHTISLHNLVPGTVYHYRVTSIDIYGNRAVSADSTFTTMAIPVTAVPASHGAGGSYYSNTFTGVLGPPQQPVKPEGSQQPGFPVQPASLSGQAFQSYPIGWSPGIIYNADGQGTLFVGIDSAHAAGATVTIFADRIEIYQHHSPGVLFTFWGNNLTINNGNITGLVSRAEFVTDPLNATLVPGTVSGSVHATLLKLIQRGTIDLTLSGDVSTDTQNQFRDILSRNGLPLDAVALTLDVHKVNLTTGPANVTFAIPASWVDAHGGKDAVRITRISEETGKQELIDTIYEGVDAQGDMIFRGDSPNGTSLFGLVTAGTTAAAQETHPNGGMFASLIGIPMPYLVVLIGVIALLAVTAYFGWQYRQKKT
ncbi:MAG: fibronectin type III domain-containing protein [Methanoregula sp.]|jgi:hypothetical protein|uniref:fibronectin type III domain-containing protein n=1 Tax=Methanoregula sp. TaxID=2052170 RepID=UPI003D0AE2D7